MKETQGVSIAKNVMQNEAKAIMEASARINHSFEEAIEILNTSDRKIVITGIGKSGHLGKKMSATLCSTGSPSAFLHPSEAVHGDLGIHQAGDPVIFLSNSGTTPELISLEPVLRKRGAKIIGILGRPQSALGEKVDAVLDASVQTEADPLGIVPTASLAVAAAIGDSIASALMEKKNFSENDYAVTHPAGQLGRNLILSVEDVMHKPQEIACVDETTSIKDVVVEMTTFPLGAACVVNENKRLVGIITDGDLRRALNQFEDLKQTEAKKIMTTNPSTINPDASLGEALKIMEERLAKISVLPVLSEKNLEVLGLVRIHDIYDPNRK